MEFAEWFGQSFQQLSSEEVGTLGGRGPSPQEVLPSTRRSSSHVRFRAASVAISEVECARFASMARMGRGGLGIPEGEPVIVCPKRFEEDQLLIRWLAEIVGFAPSEAMVAREVPFMRSTSTRKAAGMIDLGSLGAHRLTHWHGTGLEIQAVYFSGQGNG